LKWKQPYLFIAPTFQYPLNQRPVMSARYNDYVNDESTPICFIRRADRNGWVRARAHHNNALNAFLAEENNGMNLGEQGVEIRVPHTDGGQFVASFHRSNEEVCVYNDEYGNRVEIAMLAPLRAAFINRIIG